MKIGFTGTQGRLTPVQYLQLKDMLEIVCMEEFHHGDCIGADAHAHDIVNGQQINIIVHPPVDSKKRVFCVPLHGMVLDAKPYLERNHDIVDATDALVATPDGGERLRSGTWATIRYADAKHKLITIIYPDGGVEHRNGN